MRLHPDTQTSQCSQLHVLRGQWQYDQCQTAPLLAAGYHDCGYKMLDQAYYFICETIRLPTYSQPLCTILVMLFKATQDFRIARTATRDIYQSDSKQILHLTLNDHTRLRANGPQSKQRWQTAYIYRQQPWARMHGLCISHTYPRMLSNHEKARVM